MEDHLIFFIDILGFSHAVENGNDEKLSRLTTLLQDLASWRSNASYEEAEIANEESERVYAHEINFQLAITTFSDNIVISTPIQTLQEKLRPNWLFITFADVASITGLLAAKALSLDLLIRGGATIGPLYHKDNVVVGQAMVEAYRLESKVANYPRISLSNKVYSEALLHDSRILEDVDGIKHFDYFKVMFLQSLSKGKDDLQDFITQSRQIITTNIARFENDQYWNERAKWVWFSRQFEKCASDYEFVFKE